MEVREDKCKYELFGALGKNKVCKRENQQWGKSAPGKQERQLVN